MDIIVFPTYGELFPNEPIPNLESLLQKVPPLLAIQIYSFANSRTHLRPFDLIDQERIFGDWLRGIEKSKRSGIYYNYIRFKSKIENSNPKGQITIFNPITLLQLVEQFLTGPSFEKSESSQEEMELFLLKIYLLKNEHANSKEKNIEINAARFYEFIITQVAAQYEFTNRKDIFSQLLIAIEFFRFLSKSPKFSLYYNEFLELKKIKSHGQYLMQIIAIYNHSMQNQMHNNFTIDNAFFISSFFDSISHDLSQTIEKTTAPDKDFKIIRDKPLLKLDHNKYCPLHFNFFIDKVYSGLIFDFYKSTSLKTKYPKFNDYLKELGTIIEENVFHRYIEKCFKNKYTIKVDGSKYSSLEYSDYYVRENNSIFLFEFKNSIIKSSVKYSGDYKQIEDEIKSKLYYDKVSNQDKGIKQLKKVIQKLANGGFEFDKYREKTNGQINIYPVIVYTDNFFQLMG